MMIDFKENIEKEKKEDEEMYNMDTDYNKTELNEYVKKRWDVWNQIHKAKNT